MVPPPAVPDGVGVVVVSVESVVSVGSSSTSGVVGTSSSAGLEDFLGSSPPPPATSAMITISTIPAPSAATSRRRM